MASRNSSIVQDSSIQHDRRAAMVSGGAGSNVRNVKKRKSVFEEARDKARLSRLLQQSERRKEDLGGSLQVPANIGDGFDFRKESKKYKDYEKRASHGVGQILAGE